MWDPGTSSGANFVREEKFDCLIEYVLSKVIAPSHRLLLVRNAIELYLKRQHRYSLVDKLGEGKGRMSHLEVGAQA